MYFYLQYIIYIYIYIYGTITRKIFTGTVEIDYVKKKTEEESDKSVVNCKLKTECELWGEWNWGKPFTAY